MNKRIIAQTYSPAGGQCQAAAGDGLPGTRLVISGDETGGPGDGMDVHRNRRRIKPVPG